MAVRSALPPYRHEQADVTRAMATISAMDPAQQTLLERLHANSGVASRHTVLPLADYAALDGLGSTNDLYIEHATDLGAQALSSALAAAGLTADAVDLLIVTSVTGVAVPSLDARLIPLLGLRADLKRVPIFGLGCVAGAAGLARLHDYLLAWPEHTAALLAVELCSLTIPVARPTTPDLVASGLFGDGAVALVARGAAHAAATPGAGPRIVGTASRIYPGTADVLAWRLDDDGFRIVLTAELSEVIGQNLGADLKSFLAPYDLEVQDIRSWVCHPGGPKVIDAVQDCLGLDDAALELSRRSLAEVGNMSSASVLHVLQETIGSDRPPPGSPGLLIGLGPGVSIELILLRW